VTYQVARFSQRFTTINVDIRGYGFSDKPTTRFSLEDMADDVASLMKSESVDCAIIAGCSVVSGIGLLFGLDRPELTEALVLIGGNIQNRIDWCTSPDLPGYRRKHMRELFAPGFPENAAGAYWLLDEIALAQRHIIPVKREDIQVWDLKVNADQTATQTCGDGNGLEVYSKPIPFTDFPQPGIRFYYADWVIHLPSEY